MISVRLGGIVPRETPCNTKEVESLRDGPFSSFRPSSNASLEGGASERSLLKAKEKNALSETDVEDLEPQEAQTKQGSVVPGPRVEKPPVTDKDEDEVDDEFNDKPPEADRNSREAEEEFESAVEADDTAQPSLWESQILCVADPFIPAKVNLAVTEGMTHPLPGICLD
jgi:hypothetical protein